MADASLKIRVSADVLQAMAGIKQLATELNATGNVSAAALGKINNAFSSVPASSSVAAAGIDAVQAAIFEASNAATAGAAGFNRYGNSVKVATVQTGGLSQAVGELRSEVSFFGGGLKNTNIAADKYTASIRAINTAAAAASPKLTKLQQDVAHFGALKPLVQSRLFDSSATISEIDKVEKKAVASGAKTGNALQKGFSSLRTLANILPGIGIAGIFGVIIEGASSLVTALVEAAGSARFLKDKIAEANAAINTAQAATAGERAELESLVAVANNEALSREARTEAIKKLQSIYPGYFDNVKIDGKLSENLAAITDKLTQSILLNAKAKALQKQIDESALRVAEKENGSLFDNLGVLSKIKAAFIANTTGGGAASALAIGNLALKDFNELTKKESELQKALAKLLTETNTKMAVQGTLFDDKTKKTKTPKVVPLGAIIDIKPSLPTRSSVIKAQQDILDIVNGTFKEAVDATKAQGAFELRPTVTLNPDILIPDKFLEQVGIRFDEVVAKINDTIKQTAIDGITGLAAGIGEALAGGGNPFSGFINILGQGLQDLGKYLITISPIISAIKLALKSLNPAVLLPAGIALVAVGAALKSVVGKGVKAFADGGIVTGPTNALIGERGPEVVFPLNQLSRFIRGFGDAGPGGLEFVESRISGDDIVQVYKRVTRRQGRI